MMNSKEALGISIQVARKRNHMTMDALAKRLNKSIAYVSRIENGKMSPEVEVLDTIAHILNTPLEQLLTNAKYISNHKEVYYNCLQKDFIHFIEKINENMYYDIDIDSINPSDMDQALWTIDGLLHVLYRKYPRNGE